MAQRISHDRRFLLDWWGYGNQEKQRIKPYSHGLEKDGKKPPRFCYVLSAGPAN
jgi:hypothetical protein